ncbi:TolC family protein [Mucilaginibacter galii]|uniref:Transporter n=1 Tax=Mucilaginibacter galii TaxID=2005073 RepID=A0A917JEJ2_9SPHI|nr:TolC family protein [Mucilaginibacter galii]GGI52274.1 transporter [Mucilaginibacter galii]
MRLLNPLSFLSKYLFSSLFILYLNQATAQISVTINQAIDSTLKRNLQIRQAILDVELSTENLKLAKYNLLPNLSAGTQASFNWGRTLDVSTYNYINQRVFLNSGNLSTQFTIFQGGSLRAQIIQNKILLEANVQNIDKLKYDLTLGTLTAFLQIIAAEELLLKARQQSQLSQFNINKVKIEVRAGNKSSADLAQAEAQKAANDLTAVTIQNQLDVSLLALKQLMEMPDLSINVVKPTLNDISRAAYEIDSSNVISEAIKINPDIKIEGLKVRSALQNIALAKSSLFPSIILFGSAGSNYSSARSLATGSQQVGVDTVAVVSGTNQAVVAPAFLSTIRNYTLLKQFSDNFYQSVGITAQIPIFNRHQSRGNISKAKINLEIAKLNEMIVTNNFKKVMNQAFFDWRAAQKRLIAAEINLSALQKVLYVSEKRYRAGLLNSIEYYTTLTNYNNAELGKIQATYDLVFRRSIIDYYLNRPIRLE